MPAGRGARCAGAKMAKSLRPLARLPILGPVIGDGFEAVLTAAQGGSETAFSRLWRDGNPALLRYLRVMVPEASAVCNDGGKWCACTT